MVCRREHRRADEALDDVAGRAVHLVRVRIRGRGRVRVKGRGRGRGRGRLRVR